jgi:gamma-glutamylcyclotransferase (GGCT)/AIG2-like uncharacterized protein YtfP
MRSRTPRAGASAGPTILFTYGTLMRGYPLHGALVRRATFLGPARASGRLLDLGAYPGLIDGDGAVHGELYRLDAPELLRDLDREEGYNFQRRRTVVTLGSGRRALAWVYRYRGSRANAVPIPHGDYRRVCPRSHG